MKLSRRNEEDMDLQMRPLADDDLRHVAGGGASGGPICPNCRSTNVDFDQNRHIVLKCHACGYVNPLAK